MCKVSKMIFMFFGLVIINNYTYSQFSYRTLLKEYKDSGYLTNQYNYLVYQIADSYTKNTKFEDRITLNDTIEDKSLNIYIINNDAKEVFPDLECNCGSIGYKNTIICDAKLFSYLQQRLNYVTGSDDIVAQSSADRFSFFLAQWILGHEIGHVILNHKIGQSYFSNFEDPLSTNQANIKYSESTTYSSKESEADSFAVKLLNAKSRQNAFWFWLGLSNMISTNYPQFLNNWRQSHDSTITKNDTILLGFNSFQHPPWLVRYLDMVQLLLKTFPEEVTDNTGYFESIRNKIKLIESKNKTNYPFCDYSLLSKNLPVEPSKKDDAQKKIDELLNDDSDYEWSYQRGSDFFYTNNFSKSQREFQNAIMRLEKKGILLKDDQKELLASALFYNGLLFLKDNLIDSSISNLSKSVYYKQESDSYKYLSICLLLKKKSKDGLQAIAKSLSLNKFDPINYIIAAVYFYDSNELQKAYTFLTYAYLIDSNSVNELKLKYEYLIPFSLIKKIKDLNKIFVDFESKNVLKDKDLFNFQNELAYYYYQNGMYSKALNLSDSIAQFILQKEGKTVEDTLQLAEIYNFLGMINNAAKSKNEAIRNYKLSLSVKEKVLSKNVTTINFSKGQSNYNLGNIYFNDSLFSTCLDYYKIAFAYYSLDTNKTSYYLNEKTKLYYKLGIVYLELGEVQNGLEKHLITLKNYSLLREQGIIPLDNLLYVIKYDLDKLITISKKKSFLISEFNYIKSYKIEITKIVDSAFKKDGKKLITKINTYFSTILSKH